MWVMVRVRDWMMGSREWLDDMRSKRVLRLDRAVARLSSRWIEVGIEDMSVWEAISAD